MFRKKVREFRKTIRVVGEKTRIYYKKIRVCFKTMRIVGKTIRLYFKKVRIRCKKYRVFGKKAVPFTGVPGKMKSLKRNARFVRK